jgi:hypothetical protein
MICPRLQEIDIVITDKGLSLYFMMRADVLPGWVMVAMSLDSARRPPTPLPTPSWSIIAGVPTFPLCGCF